MTLRIQWWGPFFDPNYSTYVTYYRQMSYYFKIRLFENLDKYRILFRQIRNFELFYWNKITYFKYFIRLPWFFKINCRIGIWRLPKVKSFYINCRILNFNAIDTKALVLQAATPSAISTILMAEAYKKHRELAAKVFFTTTIISTATIPIIFLIINYQT